MALGLTHAENALHALTAGQVDAVVDPDGNPHLLRPAQEHLLRNEARLQSLLNSIPDVVTVLNRTGEVQYQSPSITRVLGYQPDELVGRSFFDFVHPEDLDKFSRVFTEVSESLRSNTTVEFRHQTPAGTWCPLEATLGTFGPLDSPTVTITFHDATHRRLANEAFARREAASTQGSIDKDRFLAMLVHELRTPLTPALMGVCILQSDPRLVDAHETLALIKGGIEMQARLLEELMDYISIGQQKLRLQIEPINAHEALHRALETCASEISAARINVLLDLKATEKMVLANPLKLQQVLWNLLRNAAKFSSPDGNVFLTSTNEAPGRFTLEIADEGVGIEPEFLPSVFDAYQQGSHSQHTRPGGLGLGMFISKGLMEALNGSLTVSSAGRGCGTEFRISLETAGAPPAENGSEGFPEIHSRQGVEEAGVR
jgi:PAS domain S-box-containing protein